MITPIEEPNNFFGVKSEITASAEDRKQAKIAADALTEGFTWDDTAEGSQFWESVVQRLEAIANGEPLK